MRLEIELKPQTRKFLIPINYNFPLSSAIYRIFESFAPNFSMWLHNEGYQNTDGKRFKFFSFSKLYFEKMQIDGNMIIAEGNVKFYFTSPLADTLIMNFVNGLLTMNNFFLGNNETGVNFKVMKASLLPIPEFSNLMKYKMLSPTITSIQIIENEKKKIRFLYPDNPEVSNTLAKNLLNKYYILFDRNDAPNIEIQPDFGYIQKQGGAEKVMKLITIKENAANQMKVKGFITPITIKAPVEIQKVAYYCGLGERNSLGFGCLDVKE